MFSLFAEKKFTRYVYMFASAIQAWLSWVETVWVRRWVETVGSEVDWSNLVEMVYAVWFNLIWEIVGWGGLRCYNIYYEMVRSSNGLGVPNH